MSLRKKVDEMFEFIFTTLITTLSLMLVLCFYMLYRNEWVYRAQTWIINNDWDNYYNYSSYEEMMFGKVFCYDINKFKKEGAK